MQKNFSTILSSSIISILIAILLLNLTILLKDAQTEEVSTSKTDFSFGYTTFSLGFSQHGQPKYLISQSFLKNKTFDVGIATFYQKYIYLKSGDTILNQTNNKLIFFEQNPYYLFFKYNYNKFYTQLNLGYYSTSNSTPYTILNREGSIQNELYFKSNSLSHYLYGSLDLGYQFSHNFSLFANFSSIEVESLYKQVNINNQTIINTSSQQERNFIFTLNLSYRVQFQKSHSNSKK